MVKFNPTATIQEEFAEQVRQEHRSAVIMKTAPILVLVAMVIVFIFINGVAFISPTNLVNLLNQMALPLVVALGLTFVIMIGSIDLSIDGAVGMAASLFACFVLNNRFPNDMGIWGLFLTLAIGCATGLLVGLSHVYLRIPSFMASFSFMYICKGIAYLSYRGEFPTIMDPLFVSLAKTQWLGIPFITWVAVLMFIICWYIQEYTAFGRHVYAVGTNEGVLRSVGVSVEKVKVGVFTLAGSLFAVAGILGAIRLGFGQVVIGNGKMFPAQAAVVVGGTALSGGKGGVVNTIVGVLIMTVLDNGLIMMGINPNIRTGVQGVIILISVILTAARGAKVISK